MDNLLVQDSGSQLLFPMDVSLTLDEVQNNNENNNETLGGNLKHVASACSTLAFDDPDAEVPLDNVEHVSTHSTGMVLGSAPAAPISTIPSNKGILQSSGGGKINRKNSQVCFRDEEAPGTPLLNPRHANAGDHGDAGLCSNYIYDLVIYRKK